MISHLLLISMGFLSLSFITAVLAKVSCSKLNAGLLRKG